jgi:5-oxoprolinase (ATP-hydrolysing) subunit A
MGELEARLMEHITSANIACGGHAGDEATMERTVRLALERGVRIGAHPGYPDRANFGRLEIAMSEAEIALTVREQIERLDAVVRRLGGAIVHVKPHGALYNVAVRNQGSGARHRRGVAQHGTRKRIPIFGLAGSPMLEVWRGMGLRVAARGSPTGAMRPTARCARASSRRADYRSGGRRRRRPCGWRASGGVETICVHGDTPGAAGSFRRIRSPRWRPRGAAAH